MWQLQCNCHFRWEKNPPQLMVILLGGSFFEFYQKRICQAVPRWDSQDTMFCMLIMSRIGGNGFKGSKTYRHWLYNFHYDYVNWMKLGYTNLLVNERSSDVSPQSSGFNELLRTFTRVAPTGQEPITPW